MKNIFTMITFPVTTALQKPGRNFAVGIYTTCLVLIVLSDRTCMGAKLGSRSYEYDGVIPYSNNNGLNYFNYNQPYNSEVNSDENQTRPKSEALERPRLNARYAPHGVEHGNTFTITVYQWNNHLGRPASVEWTDSEVDLRECKPIPIKYTGKVRSLNTHSNCVVLYSREGCRGAFRIFKVGSPSHNRLSDLCFHKKPMSVRPCTEEEKVGNGKINRTNGNHL